MARHRFGFGGALLFAAGLVSACGGVDRGRPEGDRTAPVQTDAGDDPCAAGATLTFQSIISFDPPDGATMSLTRALCDPLINPNRGVDCTYFNFDSVQSPRVCTGPLTTNLATCRQPDLTPMPDSVCMTTSIAAAGSSIPVTPIPGGRCAVSNDAFHLAGTRIATCFDTTNQKQGWGSTFQITFNPSQMNSGTSIKPIDASEWDGISLWARLGTGPSGTSMLVSVEDPYSAVPLVVPPGAITCNSMDPLPGELPRPDATKCDPFGAGVLLTPEWRLIKLPFAKLQQKGFGLPSPLGHLDTTALVGMQFAFSAGDWDAWIDDVAFYREQ